MTVDGETKPVKAGDFVYVPSGQTHGLVNTGTRDMHMMFVYAPKMIAEHWGQELDERKQ
jgi:mannose-6-phosphate isomerase-like protein (cupin superfamily)